MNRTDKLWRAVPLRPASSMTTWDMVANRTDSSALARSEAVGARTAEVIDEVEETRLESFPASDPPDWTGTIVA